MTRPIALKYRDELLEWGQTGFGFKSPSEEQLTYQLELGCITIRYWGMQRLSFLVLFLLNIPAIMYQYQSDQRLFVLCLFNEFFVACVLRFYDQIDDIQRLQQHADQAKQQKQELEARFQHDSSEWDKILQLVGLWNCWLDPFLELMTKIHRAIDSKDRQRMVDCQNRSTWLRSINEQIYTADARLKKLDWTSKDDAAQRYRGNMREAFQKLLQLDFNRFIESPQELDFSAVQGKDWAVFLETAGFVDRLASLSRFPTGQYQYASSQNAQVI